MRERDSNSKWNSIKIFVAFCVAFRHQRQIKQRQNCGRLCVTSAERGAWGVAWAYAWVWAWRWVPFKLCVMKAQHEMSFNCFSFTLVALQCFFDLHMTVFVSVCVSGLGVCMSGCILCVWVGVSCVCHCVCVGVLNNILHLTLCGAIKLLAWLLAKGFAYPGTYAAHKHTHTLMSAGEWVCGVAGSVKKESQVAGSRVTMSA